MLQGRERSSFSQADAQKRAQSTKARRMVGEGAYRKTLNSLTTKAAVLTPPEQKQWADKILPKSDSPGHALSPQREEPRRQPPPNLRAPARRHDGDDDEDGEGDEEEDEDEENQEQAAFENFFTDAIEEVQQTVRWKKSMTSSWRTATLKVKLQKWLIQI